MSSEWQSRANEVIASASHTESRSHNEISSLLEEMGVKHENEFSPLPIEGGIDPGGFLAVDMAIPSTRTAIEFNGPSHYLGGKNGTVENGRTKTKARLLGKLGWEIVSIPWFEWKDLRGRRGRSLTWSGS